MNSLHLAITRDQTRTIKCVSLFPKISSFSYRDLILTHPLFSSLVLSKCSLPLLTLVLAFFLNFSTSSVVTDGELFQHKDTRVPSEPRYDLRKRTHFQKQQKSMLLLFHKFEKLSIREMSEEDLSKTLKESVDQKGLSFPPSPIIF